MIESLAAGAQTRAGGLAVELARSGHRHHGPVAIAIAVIAVLALVAIVVMVVRMARGRH